jgi:myosin heavy subunit
MALTRKMLKGMGLTEEQIDTIIEGHDETVSGLKDKITDLTTRANEADALRKERDDLQKTVDAAKGDTDWKAEYDKLKADTEAKETASKVKAAYRQLLKDAKLDDDMLDTVMEATRFDDMKLDRDGKTLKDADKLTESITSKWSKFIVTENTKTPPVKTPPDGKPTPMTRADIYAKDDRGRYKLSTEERQKALQTHPELMQPGAK